MTDKHLRFCNKIPHSRFLTDTDFSLKARTNGCRHGCRHEHERFRAGRVKLYDKPRPGDLRLHPAHSTPIQHFSRQLSRGLLTGHNYSKCLPLYFPMSLSYRHHHYTKIEFASGHWAQDQGTAALAMASTVQESDPLIPYFPS